MTHLQKVLVVDNGERAVDCALATELAEMGIASVTASFDAADDVLELIPSPTAIVLKLPGPGQSAQRRRFLEFAERLRARWQQAGIPVILVEPTDAAANGGFASVLQGELGTRVLSQPEL
jgi:hypothetical protein